MTSCSVLVPAHVNIALSPTCLVAGGELVRCMVSSVVCSPCASCFTHPSLSCSGKPSAGLSHPPCLSSPSLLHFTRAHSRAACASTARARTACAQARQARARPVAQGLYTLTLPLRRRLARFAYYLLGVLLGVGAAGTPTPAPRAPRALPPGARPCGARVRPTKGPFSHLQKGPSAAEACKRSSAWLLAATTYRSLIRPGSTRACLAWLSICVVLASARITPAAFPPCAQCPR